MSSEVSIETDNTTPSSSHNIIPNTLNPTNPLITINTSNITKLTPTNYITWCLQIRSLLEGYDLYGFVDGSHVTPPSTITVNNSIVSNPEYTTWKRQDRLLFSALLGAISQPLQPLLTRTSSSQEAWHILAKTYATPSRGHIKQIKDQMKTCVKGTKSITEYMQFLKTRADELALLGKPIDDEDLIDKILDGLGDEYKGIIDAVNACETTLSFEELLEKLINKEASLQQSRSSTLFPVTANPAAPHRPQVWKSAPHFQHPPTTFRPTGQQPTNFRPPSGTPRFKSTSDRPHRGFATYHG